MTAEHPPPPPPSTFSSKSRSTSRSEVVWYFIVCLSNRHTVALLGGCLEIKNFSSRVDQCACSRKICHHLQRNFISLYSHVISSICVQFKLGTSFIFLIYVDKAKMVYV